MTKAQFLNYSWITALTLGGLSVLDEYGWVVIKGLTKYNFELLLAAFVILIVTKFFKK